MPQTAARLVFAGIPLMLREMLTGAIAEFAEVEAIEVDPDSHAVRLDFDLAIVDMYDGELTSRGRELLEMAAFPKVLSVHDSRRCVLYELRPHRTAVGELSSAVLAQALGVRR